MAKNKSKTQLRPANRLPEKTGDKLDRYRAHYLKGAELTRDEKDMLDKYRRIHALFCETGSRKSTIEFFHIETNLSEPQCYLIFRESLKLFGDISKTDKEGERFAAYEYYVKIANSAFNAGEYDTALKAKAKADELMGLFDKDNNQIDPTKFIRPTQIVFSTNINVLKEAQKEETLDISHSEE